METTEFWDHVFAQGQEGRYGQLEMPDLDNPVLRRALVYFGDIKNKTLIDVGCGSGAPSLFFAYHGADVISIDSSGVAVENLSQYCQENGIGNIKPVKMPAQEISELEKADFVFGSMILHHIEPFEEFARNLREILKPGGKGFFRENNARSSVMIWFRQNIVGKLWVPKDGDPDEFPLTPGEVDEMRKHFNVEIEYPEMLLFQLFSRYVLRGHLGKPFQMLDDFCGRYPALRKYSYRQNLYIS